MNLTYDSQMFRETFESEFTWLNGFMRNVRRFSDKPAAIDPQSGRTWSYKELNADANRFANAMKKDGVKKKRHRVYAALQLTAVFVRLHCAAETRCNLKSR